MTKHGYPLSSRPVRKTHITKGSQYLTQLTNAARDTPRWTAYDPPSRQVWDECVSVDYAALEKLIVLTCARNAVGDVTLSAACPNYASDALNAAVSGGIVFG